MRLKNGTIGTVGAYERSIVRVDPELPPYTPTWVSSAEREVLDQERFECLVAAHKELNLIDTQVELQYK